MEPLSILFGIQKQINEANATMDATKTNDDDKGATWWVYFLTIFEFCLAFTIIGTVKFIVWRKEKNQANQTDLLEDNQNLNS